VTTSGVLILESGAEFQGLLRGAPVSADRILASSRQGYGEAVFNTSMTGYQEILTDPSYYGQIVCMTAPHIGNTGVNEMDPESSRPWCAGFVIHELCATPSNSRSQNDLESYLKDHGIPALSDVDTRALTLHLRSRGVERALILPTSERHRSAEIFGKLPRFEGRDLIAEVTTREMYRFEDKGEEKGSHPLHIVAMDFGIKTNLLRSLAAQGCSITVVPASTGPEKILALRPDGLFLSNGPGDPAAAPYAVETIRKLLGKLPIFGVCMGHQLLALAAGAKTYKLKFGHRGGNQPVLDNETGRVEISSHNHGYAVDSSSLPAQAKITHISLNDRTVEGIAIPSANAFSVQYHPEACPGPHDSAALFDRFAAALKRV